MAIRIGWPASNQLAGWLTSIFNASGNAIISNNDYYYYNKIHSTLIHFVVLFKLRIGLESSSSRSSIDVA